jgi:hypothetical protein
MDGNEVNQAFQSCFSAAEAVAAQQLQLRSASSDQGSESLEQLMRPLLATFDM